MALGRRDRREAAIMSASRQNPTTTRLAKVDSNQATLRMAAQEEAQAIQAIAPR